jgi:transcriptional regulator with XRE-family HTH domain
VCVSWTHTIGTVVPRVNINPAQSAHECRQSVATLATVRVCAIPSGDVVDPADYSWQGKVRALLSERGESARSLAKQLGRSERTVRSWLDGGPEARAPLGEGLLIEQIAAALGVTGDWLRDGKPGPAEARIVTSADVAGLLERVPRKYRRLALALLDQETADHLLVQLDLYERARLRGRSRPA